MKRALGIAATVLLTACISIPNPEGAGTAPADRGPITVGSGPSGAVDGASPILTDGTRPLPNPGLLGWTWDSGYQQCQVGDHKINYRFWLTRDLTVGLHAWNWIVHYEVRAEDRRSIGRGWRQVNQLAYIRGSFYDGGPFGNGGPRTIGYRAFTNQGAAQGDLASGIGRNGLTEVSIRVERFGGPSGLYVVWPGDGCHEG